MGWFRGALIGFLTPIWVRGPRLRQMLDRPRGNGSDPVALDGSAQASLVVMMQGADLTLRVLARVPRSPWRATCLFRSVAECRCREAAGVGGRLLLGARQAADGTVAAHAWVEPPLDARTIADGVAYRPFGRWRAGV
jgi:hypothetical protein